MAERPRRVRLLHVEGRPDQACLLGSPPGEAKRVLRLDLGHLLGDLEDRCRSGAVVVDPGPFGDGVEVCSDHDHVVRRSSRPSRRARSTWCRALSAYRSYKLKPQTGRRRQLLSEGLSNPRHPEFEGEGAAQGAVEGPRRRCCKMTTPTAPALAAFVALTANVHVPRLMRAMCAGSRARRSRLTHTLEMHPRGVEPAGQSPRRSHRQCPNTSCRCWRSDPLSIAGATCSRIAGLTSVNLTKSNGWIVTL